MSIPGWEFKIHSYGVMILLACFAALAIAVWRARRDRIDPNVVYELATWLFLGGVVGARGSLRRSAHLESIHSLGDVLRSWQGGNNFYGCILGGLTGSILYWFRRPFPFWLMTDVAAPAVAIGIAIGRIGCFLNGCCYGAVCDLPWAVCFPGRVARLGSPGRRRLDFADWRRLRCRCTPRRFMRRSPGLRCSACCWRISRRRRAAGEVMAVLMIAYPLTRWPLEMVRGDEPAIFCRHDLSQNISVALFACGLAVWFGSARASTFTAATQRPSRPARRLPVSVLGSALGLALAPGRAGGGGE